MSTTERYGTYVWQALNALAFDEATHECTYYGVGEVARVAKVSKPTAKKYLDMLIESQHVERVTLCECMRTIFGYRLSGKQIAS